MSLTTLKFALVGTSMLFLHTQALLLVYIGPFWILAQAEAGRSITWWWQGSILATSFAVSCRVSLVEAAEFDVQLPPHLHDVSPWTVYRLHGLQLR